MAIMIPARMPPDAPTSERLLFDRLRLDPGTEAWNVLHSLELSHHGAKPYGEIDFVVLVAGLGVACLEVKGGRVSCKDGVWTTLNRNGERGILRRSPFAQAREGMFALRDAVRDRFKPGDPARDIPMVSGVVFPHVTAPPDSPDHESWEVIDVNTLRKPISDAIRLMLHEQRGRLGLAHVVVDAPALREVRNFLRPDFDRGIARSTTIRQSEERILQLTAEQLDTLDALERNRQCFVEGAAGTGKTTMAFEFGRRMALAGRTVMLLCYNRLLGHRLAEDVRALGLPAFRAGSVHRLLRQTIAQSSYATEFETVIAQASPAARYWELYPLYGAAAVAEMGTAGDILIVDEAQDLATRSMVDVFDAWVTGGVAGGSWVLCGDFTRQSLFAESAPAARLNDLDELVAELGARGGHPARIPLRRNCRNTRPIGEETALLSGFPSLPYRLDSHDALKVDYRHWSTPREATEKLRAVLESLLQDGVASEEIVVLSPLKLEHSCAGDLGPVHGCAIADLGAGGPGRSPNQVAFCTVQGFKGMESPVVILCDIDRIDDDAAQALLYVGMSRARSHLVVLLHSRLRSALSQALVKRLTQGWSA